MEAKALFLNILKAALSGETLAEADASVEVWTEVLRLARQHSVLPMVHETVYRIPALRDGTVPAFTEAKRFVYQQILLQTVKTEEYLRLDAKLRDAGVRHLVVKGLVCRQLYPKPDQRFSSDEDVLIDPARFDACHAVLGEFGLQTEIPESERGDAYEIPYRKPGSPLYIELHKQLFPPESDAYGDWNRFFDGVFDRAVTDGEVPTMGHTDHLFYLICHAFKHFLHSGFGIRQVCDIVMYANAYGSSVDWRQIFDHCGAIHARLFTAALLQIGRKYLTFDPQKAGFPDYWQALAVDEGPMLEDLLSGGIYGGATMSRRHSSNMTLDAVAADKQGKKQGAAVLGSLFPPARKLEGRYPYLKRHPWLLPAAWVSRIVKYGAQSRGPDSSGALEAVKIGSQRIELLRRYGVIE